jgi:hypothetical protein
MEMCEEEYLNNNVKKFELVFSLLFNNFKLYFLNLKKKLNI